MTGRTAWKVALLAAALLAALAVDVPVSRWIARVRPLSPDGPLFGRMLVAAPARTPGMSNAQWQELRRRVQEQNRKAAGLSETVRFVAAAPGTAPYAIVAAIAVGVLHRNGRFWGTLVVWTSLLAGGVYSLMKWMVGRMRPIVGVGAFELSPFAGGWWGLIFPPENLCFPSGHTTLAFALAHCLGGALPRGKRLFYLIAGVVGLQRVLTGAHYPSDVVAGAAVGLGVAVLTESIVRAIVMRFNDEWRAFFEPGDSRLQRAGEHSRAAGAGAGGTGADRPAV